MQQWAGRLFRAAVETIPDSRSPRGWATALIGIDAYLGLLSGDRKVVAVAAELENRLVHCFESSKSSGWTWFEGVLAYDNAVLPHALIVRGRNNRRLQAIGLRSLRWLAAQQTAPAGHFRPIGSDGFYPRDGERAFFDQQPLEAAGMVSACIAAYQVTSNAFWAQQARSAFEWFYGKNDLGVALYDPKTGGCRDGLHFDRVNLNQGAESTLAYLKARLLIEILEARQGTLRLPSEPIFRSIDAIVTERRRSVTAARLAV
jgi:hypothetical protein